MAERRPAGAVFVIWGTEAKGRRSIVLGRALGMREIAFLADRWRPGLRGDPLKYPRQLWRTLALLLRHRPRVTFVQSPPSPAVWTVAAWAAVSRTRFVVDAHSDAFQRARWTRPRWLNRLVARRAALWLVTNEHWAAELRAAGARVMVVPDIPTGPRLEEPSEPARRPPDGAPYRLAVVNTWSSDEPLAAVVDAARELDGVELHVTGRADERVARLGPIPPNVHFTGFLDDDAYDALLAGSHGVVCLTTRDHTMQRGACEALSLGRPIVTSDWPLLRGYFSAGTVHAGSTASSIRDAIRELVEHYDAHAAAVLELRALRRSEWESRRRDLLALIEVGGAAREGEGSPEGDA